MRTSATPLDTLVNPGVPIQQGSQAIHGITDDVADAPRWAEVVPRLLEVTADRQTVCYNAGVVRGRHHTRRDLAGRPR